MLWLNVCPGLSLHCVINPGCEELQSPASTETLAKSTSLVRVKLFRVLLRPWQTQFYHAGMNNSVVDRLLYAIDSMKKKSEFPGIVCWPARGWAFFTYWSVPGFICSEDNNKLYFHVTSAHAQGSTKPTMTTAHRKRMWASGYFDSMGWESLRSTLY